MTIRARYEGGVFRPLEKVDVREGTVLEIYIPAERKRPASIKDLPFAGMWKNRRDIRDGVSYVNRLRDNPRA